MYTYGGFMLLYGRNQHNIVKQLSFNYKKKKSMPVSSICWNYFLNKQKFECVDMLCSWISLGFSILLKEIS